jgi:hypothetical protein
VTVIPSGFTVSRLSSDATPLTSRTTVTLCPDASRPEDGKTISLPIKPDDLVMDHDTGPPEAVRVRLLSRCGLSRIVVGVTLNVPSLGGGMAVAVLLAVAVPVDGAGEPGDVLWVDDGAVAEGEEPPAG